MREEDKPFICYKQGWSMKIVPRNRSGWIALALWIMALGVLLAGFIAVMSTLRAEAAQLAAGLGFALVSAAWAVAMICWMRARSEIVDVRELLELKRRRDEESRAGRRR